MLCVSSAAVSPLRGFELLSHDAMPHFAQIDAGCAATDAVDEQSVDRFLRRLTLPSRQHQIEHSIE